MRGSGAAAGLPPIDGAIQPAPLPGGVAAPMPQAMAQTGTAAATPTPSAPPPAYTDPRLNQSGQIREEFRKSGEWIR